MNVKSAILAAVAVTGLVAGCDTTDGTNASPGTGTPGPTGVATTSGAVPTTGGGPANSATAPNRSPATSTEAAPNPAQGGAPQDVPATSAADPASPAPTGSGHGLCFDLNSGLAASAVASLGAPPAGDHWVIQGASGDPISGGCADLLSWMTVEWPGIHPGTHILFFTNGTYLGTASAQPYAYTEVLGKTRDTVSVQYRWPREEDPLCCPQGGPSVVTFTLNGTTVTAQGQFPPN